MLLRARRIALRLRARQALAIARCECWDCVALRSAVRRRLVGTALVLLVTAFLGR